MTPERVPSVVHQPRSARKLQRGIHQLGALIRPTMGPGGRNVAVVSANGRRMPELLQDGGLIARRMLQLADPDEDMGAMLLRNILWHVREREGDGTATTAVLFQSVFDQGLRYISSGGNAVELRRHLHAGLDVVLDELQRMTVDVCDDAKILAVARAACPDAPLARILAGLFAVLGEYGHVELRSDSRPDLHGDCIDGPYWETPVLSPLMLGEETTGRLELQQCLILCSDLEITDPRDLVPVLEIARHTEHQGVVLVASKLSASCVAMLLTNRARSPLRAVAVRTPEVSPVDQAAALDDLEKLTGGRALRTAAGDSLRRVQPDDLGRARRIWVDRQHIGIVGGKGDPRRLRSHVRALQARHRQTDDHETRRRLNRRIGRLLGAAAVLWVNGAAMPGDARTDLTARVCTILRGALTNGAVPGGGAALLACQPRLEARLVSATDDEERAACRILLRALEEPARTIAANAGGDAEITLDQRLRPGSPPASDAATGEPIEGDQSGILDSASVLRTAVSSAVRGASQALTIDVLVHRRNPEESMLP